MANYYLDTSIWLDLFENRDKPNLQKGKLTKELINKIIKDNDKIVYSDLTITELNTAGYSSFEVEEMLKSLKHLLIFIEATERQIGKSKDLSTKRNIPRGDALGAILARNANAVLIARDKHFQKILDIIKPKKPEEIISF